MNQQQTLDAETLMTTPLPSLRFVVDRLLPQGLHLLAGAPKIGKSWLALWLCLCVAKGEPVWGFPSAQGSVLYLCLEDSYARIQRRLFELTEDAPAALHFATFSESIGTGLEEQLTQFLAAYPDTVLVVIDTLQKVRRATSAANPYANDYQDISSLKVLAGSHGIAVLLIHHLRKMNDEDPLNMISGTTGLSGATDSSFVLKPSKRGGDTATLYCTGRDIAYRELLLRFRKDTHAWELSAPVEDEAEYADPTLILLSGFLSGLSAFDGTATELAALLERQTGESLQPSVLSKKLVRYTSELAAAGIRFSATRTRDTRMLHIRCDGGDGNDGRSDTGPVANLLSQPSHLSQGPCPSP